MTLTYNVTFSVKLLWNNNGQSVTNKRELNWQRDQNEVHSLKIMTAVKISQEHYSIEYIKEHSLVEGNIIIKKKKNPSTHL